MDPEALTECLRSSIGGPRGVFPSQAEVEHSSRHRRAGVLSATDMVNVRLNVCMVPVFDTTTPSFLFDFGFRGGAFVQEKEPSGNFELLIAFLA